MPVIFVAGTPGVGKTKLSTQICAASELRHVNISAE
ncbi:hypothetical protein KIPB_015300, partial [Kipferlia bialata]|eukprot:g15300.t1